MFLRSSATLFTLVAASFLACSAPHGETVGTTENANTVVAGVVIPTLPAPGGTGDLAPWGGSDPARWRPEAILANAASLALNEAWSMADTRDAMVAVPLKMQSSDFFEFGDGQSNAGASFEWWRESRPPVVATLRRLADGSLSVRVRLDRALPPGFSALSLAYTSATGAARTASLALTRTASGDSITDWVPPADAGLDALPNPIVFLVKPEGWRDSFPLRFRMPVRPVADLKASVPAAQRRFADGGDIEDHEGMSLRTHPSTAGETVLSRLLARRGRFSTGYNQVPYEPASIHASFPFNRQTFVTGVGKGWTWVAQPPAAPFKAMYTCFERRRADLEASAPNGGVASGGGWHKIGDPAESILNDVETGPLAVGFATRNPYPASALPGGGFAFNLTDVAAIRFLLPGEAFITPRGTELQANFHWYFFHQTTDVCTEEWIHPCVPGDDLGFACTTTASVTFEVSGATTSWGQDVYVVGDAAELGAWNPRRAVKLSAAAYPTWRGNVALTSGANVAFKFIKLDAGGNVAWESGTDRRFLVPSAPSGVYTGAWR